MHYDRELTFFLELIQTFNISSCKIAEPFDEIPEFDRGLRRLLLGSSDYTKLLDYSDIKIPPNTFYRLTDPYLCEYILFLLPDCPKKTFLLIGPYTLEDFSSQATLTKMLQTLFPVSLHAQLEKYYLDIPTVTNQGLLFSMVSTLGKTMWGSMDNFSMESFSIAPLDTIDIFEYRRNDAEDEDPFLTMQILEERYNNENLLLQAIAQGSTHKADMSLSGFSSNAFEPRATDPVRNIKNYCIILNTLLRKAAETGSVHPLHIDSISSKFAKKIELLTSVNSANTLQREMIHKYCLLVKNHSLKGYSLLIRKVLTNIDADLTADLSLKAQAEQLNINASYLSTLFKKETGSTLTEYVNKKRMEHALFLLNTTNLQIQNIAQHCGFPDVNYFTKTFKKFMKKTPKEYRDEISPR